MDAEAGLRALISSSGFAADGETARALLRYLELLRRWSRRINLTASESWDNLGPLFAESLWAAEQFTRTEGRHIDIGSGAGFPALPLRLVRTGIELDLVEARWKRAVFLETVIGDLGLTGAQVHARRLDAFLTDSAGEWTTVSWKALRLGRRDLEALAAKCRPEAEIWLFHGPELPVQEPSQLESLCRLSWRKEVPGRRQGFLSVYQVRS